MKLLLTSSGITNPTLARTLKKLVGKEEIKFAFIPTAANLGSNNKKWLIRNFNECLKLGIVNIVDISAIPKSVWLPKLKSANVIVMGGGDTEYLMKQINKSGLKKELPSLLKTRIYLGISAGSISCGKKISASSDFLYSSNPKKAPAGLGYVDFNFRSHFNSDKYPKLRDPLLKKISKKLDGDLYAMDDDSAVLVLNGKISVVSEGSWKKYSPTK